MTAPVGIRYIGRVINYRTWTEEDTEALRRLVAALHDAMRPYDENYPPAPEIIEQYFQYLRSTVADTSGTFLLAEDDGRVIGFVCVFGLIEPFSPDEEPTKYTFISDLYVEPEYQGRDIGKGLLERAEAYGRALGVPRIELAVHAANAARDLYAHLGYRPRMVIMTKRLDE